MSMSISAIRQDLSSADANLTIRVGRRDETRLVKLTGELDLASCGLVTSACVDGQARAVVVDLAELTFLDCGGYQAFVAARTVLEQHDRTLTLIGAVGEPRRLLDLIQQLEPTKPCCVQGDAA